MTTLTFGPPGGTVIRLGGSDDGNAIDDGDVADFGQSDED